MPASISEKASLFTEKVLLTLPQRKVSFSGRYLFLRKRSPSQKGPSFRKKVSFSEKVLLLRKVLLPGKGLLLRKMPLSQKKVFFFLENVSFSKVSFLEKGLLFFSGRCLFLRKKVSLSRKGILLKGLFPPFLLRKMPLSRKKVSLSGKGILLKDLFLRERSPFLLSKMPLSQKKVFF